MTAISLPDLKAHLRLDIEDTSEDILLQQKIDAAEAWIGAYIGMLPEDFADPIPAPIAEAVRQLAARAYEDREGSEDVPFDTLRLLSPYRGWTF